MNDFVTKSGIPLVNGPNRRDGRDHVELHAPCGCAFDERPAPHWHPCPLHNISLGVSTRRRTMNKTMGLWRKNGIKGGKYLVVRRDGSVPAWSWFVLGARDPAAPAALRAYAEAASKTGMDERYVADVRQLADDFEKERAANGTGDPDAVPHRTDDPEIVEKMTATTGGSA